MMSKKIDVESLSIGDLKKLATEHKVPWGPIPMVRKNLTKALAAAAPATVEKPANKTKPVEAKPSKKTKPEPEEDEEDEPEEKPVKKPTKAAKTPSVEERLTALEAAVAALTATRGTALKGGASAKPAIPASIKGYIREENGQFHVEIGLDEVDDLDEEASRAMLGLLGVKEAANVKSGKVRLLHGMLRDKLTALSTPAKKAAKVKKIAGFEVGTAVVYTGKGGKKYKATVVDPEEVGDDEELEDGKVRIMYEDEAWDDVPPNKLTTGATGDGEDEEEEEEEDEDAEDEE